MKRTNRKIEQFWNTYQIYQTNILQPL